MSAGRHARLRARTALRGETASYSARRRGRNPWDAGSVEQSQAWKEARLSDQAPLVQPAGPIAGLARHPSERRTGIRLGPGRKARQLFGRQGRAGAFQKVVVEAAQRVLESA